jgi:pyrimidine operon attenuation protein/uracil phosphoribosyltransferase
VEKSSLAPREPSEPGRVATPTTIGSGEIHAAIERMGAAISSRHPPGQPLLVLGVANGGIELARRLALSLSKGSPGSKSSKSSPTLVPHAVCGVLDISFHRDDVGRHPIPKEFAPTHIPGDVQGATIILVDDVLFSGRTVKAALEELFDHGRPAKVELAVLVDRGGRLLPVAADYAGLTVAAGPDERVVVTLDSANSRQDSVSVLPHRKSKLENRKST